MSSNSSKYNQSILVERSSSLLFRGVLLLVVSLILIALLFWQNIGLDSVLFRLDTIGWVCIVVNGALFLHIVFTRTAGSKALDFAEPKCIVSLLFLLVFILRPLQILLDPDSKDPFLSDNIELIQNALLAGTVSFIAFYFGYSIKLGRLLVRKSSRTARPWQRDRIIIISILYTTIGLIGYAYAIKNSGGFDLFVYTLKGRQLLAGAGNWVFAALGQLITISYLILGAYYFRTGELKYLFLVTFILSTVLTLILGGRSSVLEPFLALFIIRHYNRIQQVRKSLRGRILTTLMVVAIVLSVVFIGDVRESVSRGEDVFVAVANVDNSDGMISFLNEFNQFDWLAIHLDSVPSTVPHQHGKTFLQYFAMFVPRTFWPDKPLTIFHILREKMGGSISGSPSTLVGEFYINFGVVGIILGMILFGIVIRASYSFLEKNRENLYSIVLYSYFVASLHRIFTRAFASSMFSFTVFLIPALVAFYFISRSKKRMSKTREI